MFSKLRVLHSPSFQKVKLWSETAWIPFGDPMGTRGTKSVVAFEGQLPPKCFK